MRFAYIVFLALYTAIFSALTVVQTVQLCKAKTNREIAFNIGYVLFFAGISAQFIADGIRVIGG